MQRFFAAIALLVIFGGSGFYYFHYRSQDPALVYQKAVNTPTFERAVSYIENKVRNWQPDPEDPQIRLPENWGKTELTIDDETFSAYSPDQENPPRYYISFNFPKVLVQQMSFVKCWGTAAEKTTDVCVVGDNPKIEAYFQILKLLKAPDFSKLAPRVEMN